MMNSKKIDIQILTKDRHSELGLLLQSLRSQTYQNFDIFILDDASGAPITSCYFINYLLTRMKLENHRVFIFRNNVSFGCCSGRNRLIDESNKIGEGELCLRTDDDVILEKDYIEKLVSVIDAGYDIASGVIPQISIPEIKRETKFVKPIINMKEFDNEGNLIKYADDCGCCFIEDEIIPTTEFRTNALYKKEVQKAVRYPDNLSYVAFREEAFFSLRAILNGFKIGIRTGAVAYHLICPSGGNRCQDYPEKVKLDNETFYKWCKEKFINNGNFLEKYYKEVIKNAKMF